MPFAMTTLLAFTATGLALCLLPGPDMLFIATRSVAQGKRAGFASLFGISAGVYIWAIATALGVSELLVAAPSAFTLIKIVGAVYLLFLAVQTVRQRAKEPSADTTPGIQPSLGAARLFRQAMMTNLLNPKVAVFFLALFPQFVDPTMGSAFWQIILLATLLNAINILVMTIVIMAAHRTRLWLGGKPAFDRVQRWLTATVFAGLAARLLVQEQP
jgi:threonine/homoserine/homoserine lactone efflux protein